jgi:hypothetical protein
MDRNKRFVKSKKNINNSIIKPNIKPNIKQVSKPVSKPINNFVSKTTLTKNKIPPIKAINIILDKINTSGYQNLTEKEKHILVELSKKI